METSYTFVQYKGSIENLARLVYRERICMCMNREALAETIIDRRRRPAKAWVESLLFTWSAKEVVELAPAHGYRKSALE